MNIETQTISRKFVQLSSTSFSYKRIRINDLLIVSSREQIYLTDFWRSCIQYCATKTGNKIHLTQINEHYRLSLVNLSLLHYLITFLLSPVTNFHSRFFKTVFFHVSPYSFSSLYSLFGSETLFCFQDVCNSHFHFFPSLFSCHCSLPLLSLLFTLVISLHLFFVRLCSLCCSIISFSFHLWSSNVNVKDSLPLGWSESNLSVYFSFIPKL